MLARVLTRLRRAQHVTDVCVATSTEPADSAVAAIAADVGIRAIRGSETDVLDRYHSAATELAADVIVRVTADCPLLDPQIVDSAIELYRASSPSIDYVSTAGFPRGFDVEVFSRESLERVWSCETAAAAREHVTLAIYTTPGAFRCRAYAAPTGTKPYRLTVDTPEDLAVVRAVYDHFGHDIFSWSDVVRLLDARPDIVAINRHVVQAAPGPA